MKRLLIIYALFIFNACSTTTVHNQVISEESDNYELVWQDEFNYVGLPDSTKWSYDIEGNKWKWGNDEAQAYTSKLPKNAFVKNGSLQITAIKEDYFDTLSKEEFEYTSARIISKNKGDWLYGKFVINAKLPSGRGTWPAIWMLPTDWKYGGWPSSGEIDIMEHVGYEKSLIYGSAHTKAYNHSIKTNKTENIKVIDAEEKFHDYMLEWTPEYYAVSVDGVEYFRFKNEHKTYKEWPFDQKFHLLLNLAVGGMWGGEKGIDTEIWPQTLYIDYVRVYQKQNKLNEL